MLQQTITINIKLSERLFKLFLLVLADHIVDHEAQGGLLQFLRHIEVPHVTKGTLEHVWVNCLLRRIFEPLVLDRLLRVRSPLVVDCQHPLHNGFALIADMIPHLSVHAVLSDFDLFYNLAVVDSVEGWGPAQKNVKEHADGPNITTLVVVLIEHLGRDVIGRTVHLLHRFLLLIILDRCAEVDYLQRVVGLIVDDVLWLEVTVDHAEVVAVADRLQQLLHDFGGLELRETYLVLDRFEELNTLAQLGDEEVVDVVLEDLEYLHDVRVVQLTQDAQLRLEEFLLHRIHLRLLDDLHCPHLLPEFALTCPNFAEGALAEDLSKLITIFKFLPIKPNEVRLLNDELVLVLHGRLLDFLFFIW